MADENIKTLNEDAGETSDAAKLAQQADSNYASSFQQFESAEQKLLAQIKETSQTMKATRQKAEEMDAENLAAKTVEEGGYMSIADALEAQEQENQAKDDLRKMEVQYISKNIEAVGELFSSGIKLGTAAVDSVGTDLVNSGSFKALGLATLSGFVMNGAMDSFFINATEPQTQEEAVGNRVDQYENLQENNGVDEGVDDKYVEGETPEEYNDSANHDATHNEGSASDEYNYEDDPSVPAKEFANDSPDGESSVPDNTEGDYLGMSHAEQQSELDNMASGKFVSDLSHISDNVKTIVSKDASVTEKGAALTDLVATASTALGVATPAAASAGKMFSTLLKEKDNMDKSDQAQKDPDEIDLGV